MPCKTSAIKMKKIKIYSQTQLPTVHGSFECIVFHDNKKNEHIAMVKGDVKNSSNVLCRIHSECLTGEVLSSLKCDCKHQLDLALQEIQKKGKGILLYLRQEGRGIGLGNKIKAYSLQEKGYDTVDANLMLGFPEDGRQYDLAISILQLMNVQSVELMTNNPQKINALKNSGIQVLQKKHQIKSLPNEAKIYLKAKRDRMGHLVS